jgi:spermidine synthase
VESLGQHIIAEYFDCDRELLNDISFIERSMLDSANEAGATIVSSSFHHFSPYGISGVVVIQESHLAIHTWPEYRFASVDLFTCGDSVDPLKAYEFLKKTLKAANGSFIKMSRGSNLIADLQEKNRLGLLDAKDSGHTGTNLKRESWFTQRIDDKAISIRHRGGRLYSGNLEGLRVEIYDTFELGKMLVINGRIVLTEEEEHIYHEMLIHPVMKDISHNVNVLLIGGDFGGSIRELLKYKNVLSVTLSGINIVLDEVLLRYFPGTMKYLKNSKIMNEAGNHSEFLRNCPGKEYDLVFIDPLIGEFNNDLDENNINEIYRVLKPGGFLVWSEGATGFIRNEFLLNWHKISPVFNKNINYYAAHSISTFKLYPFLICGKESRYSISSCENLVENANLREIDCKFYNLSIHNASFCLPETILSLIVK